MRTTFEEAKDQLHGEWKNLYETSKERWEKRLAEKDEEIQSLQEKLQKSNEKLLGFMRDDVLDSSLDLAVSLQVSNSHLNTFFYPISYKEIIKKKLNEDNYKVIKETMHSAIISIACNLAKEGVSSNDYYKKVMDYSNNLSKEINKEGNPLYVEKIVETQALIEEVRKLVI